MPDIKRTLPENLLHYRKAAGFTQEQLAERLGTTQHTYSRWETGVCTPSIQQLTRIAFMFSVTVDDLLAERKEGA